MLKAVKRSSVLESIATNSSELKPSTPAIHSLMK